MVGFELAKRFRFRTIGKSAKQRNPLCIKRPSIEALLLTIGNKAGEADQHCPSGGSGEAPTGVQTIAR